MATVRVPAETHQKARELARERGEAIGDVVAAAVDRLWRDDLLDQTNAAFAALRSDPELWRQELEERAAWEAIEHWDDE